MYLSRTVRKIISPSPLGCFSQGCFSSQLQESKAVTVSRVYLWVFSTTENPWTPLWTRKDTLCSDCSPPPLSPSSPKAAPILPTPPLQGPLLSGNLYTLIGRQLLDEAFTICSWRYLAHAKHSVTSKSNPNPKQNKHKNQNPTKKLGRLWKNKLESIVR